jgi:hypothetical protein
MSKASFINTDISKIRFSDNVRWGNNDNFQVIEEIWLENVEKTSEAKRIHLGGVLSVYRNLRENYEFRRRYDEAGKFFIREMELKRKYREVKSKGSPEYELKKNCWFRRNIFSLTGWYHLLSDYGESLWRPTVAGTIIVFLATLFFVCQTNPTLVPTLSFYPTTTNTDINNQFTNTTNAHNNITSIASTTTSSFIGIAQFGNYTHWLKASERGIGDFLPLLSMPSDIKIGLSDYFIKIVGGAVVFGLIAIALRRRFERKYTH